MPVSTGISSTSTSSDGGLVGKRPALADSVLRRRRLDVAEPRVGLFRAGAFDAGRARRDAPRSRASPSRSQEHSLLAELVDRRVDETSGPSIEDADIVVAGGRGLGAPEKFALAEELAARARRRRRRHAGRRRRRLVPVLGAGRSDRARPSSPKLYVALGISGAIQHKVGMQSSGMIVAINKDPNAPIFDYADLGVVGDLHEIVPKLTELVRQRKGA